MADQVLDSSAVLADLFDEPGADLVRAAGGETWLSAVNLAEIVSKLIDKGIPPNAAREIADDLPCAVVALDRVCAVESGLLREVTRRAGLSLGDRACIALARQLDLPILTADRLWKDFDFGVEVRLIR